MCEETVKVLAALVDYCCKADNLRTSTDDDQKCEATVVLEGYVAIVCI